MFILVIYDSQFGNTMRLARLIGEVMAKRADVTLRSCAEVQSQEVKAADLLVIGCPTQRHGLTPGVDAFLSLNEYSGLTGKAAAVFDTRFNSFRWLTGSAARTTARRLERAGVRLVAPPESFFVAGMQGPLEDGEAIRAVNWARGLLEHVRQPEVGIRS